MIQITQGDYVLLLMTLIICGFWLGIQIKKGFKR